LAPFVRPGSPGARSARQPGQSRQPARHLDRRQPPFQAAIPLPADEHCPGVYCLRNPIELRTELAVG